MKLTDLAKVDNEVMRILKVNEVRHFVAQTNNGNLTLMLRKGEGENDYRFVLDSVPLEEEKSKELMRLFHKTAFFTSPVYVTPEVIDESLTEEGKEHLEKNGEMPIETATDKPVEAEPITLAEVEETKQENGQSTDTTNTSETQTQAN